MDTTSTKMAVFGSVMHVAAAAGQAHKLSKQQDSITTQRLMLSLLFVGLYAQIIARNHRTKRLDMRGLTL